MNRLCDYVLTASEYIRFAMLIDQMGNIQCIKSIGLYHIPTETAQKLKHQNYTTIGQPIKTGYLIYVTTEPIEPQIIQHIKETIQIYQKEEEL